MPDGRFVRAHTTTRGGAAASPRTPRAPHTTNKPRRWLAGVKIVIRRAMADDEQSELERLRAENERLKKAASTRRIDPRLREGRRVGLRARPLPVTLYKEQWLRLLDMADEIRSFIADNAARSKSRTEVTPATTRAQSHAQPPGTSAGNSGFTDGPGIRPTRVEEEAPRGPPAVRRSGSTPLRA